MKTYFYQLINKYGVFVLAGLIGAIVQRLRSQSISWKKFVSTLFISAFVSVSVGIVMRNYFNAPEEVIFVACGISGVFSIDILTEIEQLIKIIAEEIKLRFGTKK